MTLSEATKAGITRLRMPIWANPRAYGRIDILDGFMGPWFHLFDRQTQEAIGEPTPQTILVMQVEGQFDPYDGQLDEADNPEHGA